jgi:hypothetical protein
VDTVVFEAAACSVSSFKTNVIPFLEEQNLRAQVATLEGKDPAMTRYEPGVEKRKANFKFWSQEYREREPKESKKPTALAPTC